MVVDCVIAGAGTSACAAANVLRQSGLSVCMISPLSKQPFLVGESLPGAARPLLDRIGIAHFESWLATQHYEPCRGNVSAWGSDNWVRNDAIHNPQGGGWHLNRQAFNHALFEHTLRALIQYKEAKLIEAHYHANNWIVKTSAGDALRSRYLIDATGRASVVAKWLGLKKSHLYKQMAAVAWLASDLADKEQVTRIKGVQDGWWYSARLPLFLEQGRPVRVVAKFASQKEAKALSDSQAFIHALNHSMCLPVQVSSTQLKAPVLLTDAGVALLNRAQPDKGFIAIGDAVLSLDPLSSQGIFFALYSGIKGAEAIIQMTKEGQNSHALDDYYALIKKVFDKHQLARHLYYAAEHRFPASAYWAASLRG